MSELQILPVTGIGEIRPGDDLAALLMAAAPWLADGDILVVTSKIVSKSEGRLVEIPLAGPEREAARDAVIAAESVRVVAQRGSTRIVTTRHGLVLAAAGVDASNVERDRLVLLPLDPDRSARDLRRTLRERYKLDVAVIITDTMGRPWRVGLVDVAIGAAGIEPLDDHRGAVDAYGNELSVTQTAIIDELAAAAELVKGKRGQIPIAVVRGLPVSATVDGPGAAALVRDAATDLFSLGTAEASALGLASSASLPDAKAFADIAIDQVALDRALIDTPFARVIDTAMPTLRDVVPAYTVAVLIPTSQPDPWAIAQAGASVAGVRAILAAEGLASAWLPVEAGLVAGLAPLADGVVPLGLLAIGAPS
jgi:coenzyme F420-0:L-glutamate ligase/coenzyme F420-1:gamma-L-glutamate ligase